MRIKTLNIMAAALLLGPTFVRTAFAAETKRGPSVEIKSPAFQSGGVIPRKYTCDGSDVSPQLAWNNAPPGTKAFALVADDPDAPAGTWVHWVIYDLPPDTRELPEGVPSADNLPNGARQGLNDFRKAAYGGPCPPPGTPHRYVFKLYALDAPTGLKPGASKQQLLKAMQTHVLAEAELMGRYGR